MDIAMDIAIGSSAQIALFVGPVLVLCSFVLGPHPIALVFNGFELGAILLAVIIANHVSKEGESTWFEGCSSSRSTSSSARLLLRVTPAGIVHSPVALGGLVVLVVGLLLVDLLLFSRGRDPSFRESVAWSLGWLASGSSWRCRCTPSTAGRAR